MGGGWGSPIRAYSYSRDIYIAKLSPNGQLLWNTFLGSNSTDDGSGIITDNESNVYIIGTSGENWGLSEESIPGDFGVTVAKLSKDGELLWNIFPGPGSGIGIDIDAKENIYIAGHSSSNWGSPANPIKDWGSHAFAAKLDKNGKLIWNNFFGGRSGIQINDCVIDDNRNFYLVGEDQLSSWGKPIRAYEEHIDILVLKIDQNGDLNWHTFLGGARQNYGYGIAKNESGGIYISGQSSIIWGFPIFPFTTTSGINVIKLKENGWPEWNTFIHSGYGYDITVDNDEKVFISGVSESSWGNPIRPISDKWGDFFIAEISETGEVSEGKYMIEAYANPGGMVEPEKQMVKGGATGKINIICDEGYFPSRIIDNDSDKLVGNPYYIYNVNENHHVEVFFDRIKYPPTIQISGEIRETRSWLIKKKLLKIDISIKEHEFPMEVSVYRLYKSIPTGNVEWFDIAKKEGEYTFIDNNFPENEEVYYYVFAVVDRFHWIAESNYLVFNKTD